ncbi:hypothetical protein B0H14DRAFT_2590444 [Mycena olivaceomarginata]|nr:hypothetical protein B0H14DRAFT_2590444 [Mycena olivaceomarginata]
MVIDTIRDVPQAARKLLVTTPELEKKKATTKKRSNAMRQPSTSSSTGDGSRKKRKTEIIDLDDDDDDLLKPPVSIAVYVHIPKTPAPTLKGHKAKSKTDDDHIFQQKIICQPVKPKNATPLPLGAANGYPIMIAAIVKRKSEERMLLLTMPAPAQPMEEETAWWNSLQPVWRTKDVDGQWSVVGGYGDGGREWGPLYQWGINGVLSIVASLYFWGRAVHENAKFCGRWEAAVGDVVLNKTNVKPVLHQIAHSQAKFLRIASEESTFKFCALVRKHYFGHTPHSLFQFWRHAMLIHHRSREVLDGDPIGCRRVQAIDRLLVEVEGKIIQAVFPARARGAGSRVQACADTLRTVKHNRPG